MKEAVEAEYPCRRRLISLREVAKECAISLNTAKRLVASGELPSIKLGSRRLVRCDDLARLTTPDPDPTPTEHPR